MRPSFLRPILALAAAAAAPLMAQEPDRPSRWTLEPFVSSFWLAGEHLEAVGDAPLTVGGTQTTRRSFLRLRSEEQTGVGAQLLRRLDDGRWQLFVEGGYHRAAARGVGAHVINPDSPTPGNRYLDNFESTGSLRTLRGAVGVRRRLARGEQIDLFADVGVMAARTTLSLDGAIAWAPEIALENLDGTSGTGIADASVQGGTRSVATHVGPLVALGLTFPVSPALSLTARAGAAWLRHDRTAMLDGIVPAGRRAFWAPSYAGAENGYRLAPTLTLGLRFGGGGARQEAPSATASALVGDAELLGRVATVYSCPNGLRFSARLAPDSALLELPFSPVRLVRDPRAARLRYLNAEVTFLPRGEEATLETRLATERGCRGIPVTSPWEEASLLGYDLHAVGVQPSWSLDVDYDGETRVRFVTASGQRIQGPLPAGGRTPEGGERWEGEQDGEPFVVEVMPGECVAPDGARYQLTVRVTAFGRTLAGCGRRLTPRPAG